MDRIIEHKIEKDCLLRDFLRNRYKGRRIHFLREKGCIFVNGEPCTVAQTVKTGDVLRLVFKEELTFDYPPQDMGIREVYSDEDVLVVYKPEGVPSMPAAPHFDGNLFNGLKFLYPDGVFRVVTRLDKDTSGLVLVAKNALAHSVLHEQMEFVEKTYTALVEGVAETCCIDLPICTGKTARRY
ncbi:MAG: RluA family pseudouridine synthase, partial [Clostridiales bacterium]|nr:RluA family pseudouridine synthase [Clostridiales bacterium]